MNVEHEFQNYMRMTNPTVAKGSAQYIESRRIWHAAMWAMLCDLHNLEGNLGNQRDLNLQLRTFAKQASDPKN